jgi:hypothetical protein
MHSFMHLNFSPLWAHNRWSSMALTICIKYYWHLLAYRLEVHCIIIGRWYFRPFHLPPAAWMSEYLLWTSTHKCQRWWWWGGEVCDWLVAWPRQRVWQRLTQESTNSYWTIIWQWSTCCWACNVFDILFQSFICRWNPNEYIENTAVNLREQCIFI